jgi:hypothetical protein
MVQWMRGNLETFFPELLGWRNKIGEQGASELSTLAELIRFIEVRAAADYINAYAGGQFSGPIEVCAAQLMLGVEIRVSFQMENEHGFWPEVNFHHGSPASHIAQQLRARRGDIRIVRICYGDRQFQALVPVQDAPPGRISRLPSPISSAPTGPTYCRDSSFEQVATQQHDALQRTK